MFSFGEWGRRRSCFSQWMLALVVTSCFFQIIIKFFTFIPSRVHTNKVATKFKWKRSWRIFLENLNRKWLVLSIYLNFDNFIEASMAIFNPVATEKAKVIKIVTFFSPQYFPGSCRFILQNVLHCELSEKTSFFWGPCWKLPREHTVSTGLRWLCLRCNVSTYNMKTFWSRFLQRFQHNCQRKPNRN